MYNRNRDLPILGVMWRYFPTEREALRYARWAERVTKRSPRPCEAFVSVAEDHPAAERYEVKVRNW